LRYFEHQAPLAPTSLEPLLTSTAGLSGSDKLRRLGAELAALPSFEPEDLEAEEARHRRKEELLDRLGQALDAAPDAIARAMADVEADPDRLDELLERQNYRLARWQTAGWDLDYRRFFDINTLA